MSDASDASAGMRDLRLVEDERQLALGFGDGFGDAAVADGLAVADVGVVGDGGEDGAAGGSVCW